MEPVNEQVTGKIGMRLYKGIARVVTRESPNAVYDAALATFETSGGLFSQQASPGFIELWSLQSRMAYRLRARDGGTKQMFYKALGSQSGTARGGTSAARSRSSDALAQAAGGRRDAARRR